MTKLFFKKMLLLFPLVIAITACGGDGPGIDDDSSGAGGSNISIAYIKRSEPSVSTETPENSFVGLMDFEVFREGSAAVYVRNANEERRVTPSSGSYEIRQLSVGFDGANLLFSMRGPLVAPTEDEDEPVQPSWGLWEYDISSQELTQLTQGDAANHIHDIDPAYLPDGRIIFSSSRQETSLTTLGDEGKIQYRHLTEDGAEDDLDARTFNLHILGRARDINAVKQVTFNQSHDFNPSLTPDGKVLFSRWDNNGPDNGGRVSIYRMNPDGSAVEMLFGHGSTDVGLRPAVEGDGDQAPIRYTRPKMLDDGRVLVELRLDSEQVSAHSQWAAIDVDSFSDEGVSVNGSSGSAITHNYLDFTYSLPGVPTLDGRLSGFVPTDDGTGRYLISWDICELENAQGVKEVCSDGNVGSDTLTETSSFYGIFMYTPPLKTEKLVVVPPAAGFYYTDLALIREHTPPTTIAEVKDINSSLADEGMGILHIRSVYNMDGVFNELGGATAATTLTEMKDPSIVSADQRPARFLRIAKHVPLWDEDTRDVDDSFISGLGVMSEIVGYAEIEPDGSVMTKVPANIAFTFSVVDGKGGRLGAVTRHGNWTQLRPGETLTCTGCHDHNDGSDVAHGRAGKLDTLNTGAPNNGAYPNADPAMDALIGETMAETRARLDTSTLDLTPDIVFADVWAEPASKIASYSYTYQKLIDSFDEQGVTYLPPVNFSACIDNWQQNCRVVMNYETHIHPIWSKLRLIAGADPDADPEDRTCTTCHNHDPDPENANDPRTGGNFEVMEFPTPDAPPVQQLYLGDNGAISTALAINNNDERFDAYDYLIGSGTHPRGLAVAGVMTQQTVEDEVYEQIQLTNEDGSPQVDENGDPVLSDECELQAPDNRALLLRRSMVGGNARETTLSMVINGGVGDDDPCRSYYIGVDAGNYGNDQVSARSFFTKLENAPDTATFTGELDHRGWLTDSEIKLLREWVDMGGQYYNNPFDAPSN